MNLATRLSFAKKDFPSKLFKLNKTENEDFFNEITENSQKNQVVYIEHKNGDYKRYINPEESSQRQIKNWMNAIENDFADK